MQFPLSGHDCSKANRTNFISPYQTTSVHLLIELNSIPNFYYDAPTILKHMPSYSVKIINTIAGLPARYADVYKECIETEHNSTSHFQGTEQQTRTEMS